MFDNLSANVISALLPEMTYFVPFFGEIDFSKSVLAAIVFVGLTFLFWFLRRVVLHNAKKLTNKTSGNFDDVVVEMIQSIRAWVYPLVALYASLQFFTLSTGVEKLMDVAFYFVVVWQAIEVATGFLSYFTTKFIEKDEDGDGKLDSNSATISDLVTLIARIAFWLLGGLFILSNLGINVTSLVAGLGIGGIAIAFALQGVLSDLFASFSIYFDKPFRIGDFIVIGTDSGTVEKIGIKTTRIRTLQGEELVVSNAELTSVRVQNFKKMQERRVVAKFGITYETPQDLVHQVPDIVNHIFEALERGRLNRVHFTSFGDSALIFEVVYFIESADYTEYLNIQQAFNFELMSRFADLGIGFAYPTQTIYTKTIV